jgi:hypothetical protein
MREIIDAVHQSRIGCRRAYLPHDLPPKSATYYYFAAWRGDGTDQAIRGGGRGVGVLAGRSHVKAIDGF